MSLTVGLQPAARNKAGRIVAAAALAFLVPIALEAAGVLVGKTPSETATLMRTIVAS